MRSDLLGAMSIPPVDTGVLGFVVDNRSGFWTALAYGLSWLGSTATLTVVTIAASAAFAVFRQWRSSAMILAGSWSAYVVMIVLKRAFDRDRPPIALPTPPISRCRRGTR